MLILLRHMGSNKRERDLRFFNRFVPAAVMIWGSAPILCALAKPSPVAGQRVLTVSSDATCNTCSLTAHKVVTLTDTAKPGVLSDGAWISRGPDGAYYVTSMNAPGPVLVFDATGGSYSTIGKRGRGPGELLRPYAPRFDSDGHLHVFDEASRTVSVFRPDGNYLRSFPAPIISDQSVVLPDKSYVVAGLVASPDRFGYPMHHISSSGRLLESFGDTTPVIRPDACELARRVLAPAQNGRVWAAYLFEFVIERWDAAGKRDLTIRRNAPWFAPHLPATQGPEVVRPEPYIAALWESNGVLFVGILVADADWQALNPPPKVGETGLGPAEWHTLFDSIIEAIDIRRGEVLARLRLDQLIWSATGGILYSYREDDNGEPYFDVWSIRLTR